MKHILLFITCVIVTSSIAQTLHPNSLNLNTGGVIHDVAYDDYYDAYIVVGDFTTINGQSRNNLAFIDAQTLNVLSHNPITGINGIIRSVEVVNFVPHYNAAIGSGHRNYIYLGGNFTTINTNNKVSIARLFATHYYGQTTGLAAYNLQTAWDAQIWWDNYGPEYGVHDFHVTGDTLIAVGEFHNLFATYLSGDFDRKVIAIDADSPNFLSKNMTFLNGITPFTATATEPIQGVRQLGNRLFLFGEDNNLELINEYQLNGTYVQQIEYCNPNNETVLDFEPHTTSVDTMLFAYEGTLYGTGSYFITSYQSDGSLWNCPGISTSNTMLDFPTMGAVNYLEVYDDFIITASSNTNKLFVSKRNGTANVPFLNSFNLNSGWYNSYPSITKAPCLKLSRNLLFFSANSLSSVDGSTRNGLAVFCLEPTAAEPFTVSDPTACEGDSSIYTIPQAQCADGYRWSYTGSGALYRITGSGNSWSTLTSVELLGTNTNSIEVFFPIGSTGGTLTVEPFTVFSATDMRYSQGQSIAITVNQKPDIILAPTHTLNCYSDSTLLVAQTSNPTPQFLWTFNSNSNTLANDSLLITINDVPLFDSMYYRMTITDAVTGCFNTDSTYFTQDLIAQPIDQSAITTNPAQFTCLTDSMAVHSNIVGANVHWTSPSQTGTFPDPYWINDTTIPSGDLTVYATYISNGCSAQANFGGIIENTVQADGAITGYNYTGGGTAIDTINCTNTSLTIQCAVTAPFSTYSHAEWLNQGVPTGSDQLTITQADANGASFVIYSFRTFNDSSGCTRDYDVQITFNVDLPFIYPLSDHTINCSQSEVTLGHLITGSGVLQEGWLSGTSTQMGAVDQLTVNAAGEYYYQVVGFNGCTVTDTVVVTQTLDLSLDMPQDTLICPEQIVTIAPSIIGNTETPSYSWSTGSTNSSETATGGIDSELIVTVSTPSGCTGTDTILILITAPVVATVTPFAACSDGSLEITDIAGGAGNYQYSLDQSTWQSTTNFSGLAFGNYTVFVQDDLGCIYEFDQALDGTASTIEMLYVASTYNEEGDTIVLVNITDYTGFDSVEWILPPSANVTFESDSIAILSILIEGWYDVGLVGYIGSDCEYLYNAPVYFGGHSPVFDTSYVQNGIQSFVVYPNPTTGSFSVALEFGMVQNYSILITNSLGQAVGGMGVSGVGTVVDHTFTFPIGSPTEAYRIHVIADYDAQHKMIVLN